MPWPPLLRAGTQYLDELRIDRHQAAVTELDHRPAVALLPDYAALAVPDRHLIGEAGRFPRVLEALHHELPEFRSGVRQRTPDGSGAVLAPVEDGSDPVGIHVPVGRHRYRLRLALELRIGVGRYGSEVIDDVGVDGVADIGRGHEIGGAVRPLAYRRARSRPGEQRDLRDDVEPLQVVRQEIALVHEQGVGDLGAVEDLVIAVGRHVLGEGHLIEMQPRDFPQPRLHGLERRPVEIEVNHLVAQGPHRLLRMLEFGVLDHRAGECGHGACDEAAEERGTGEHRDDRRLAGHADLHLLHPDDSLAGGDLRLDGGFQRLGPPGAAGQARDDDREHGCAQADGHGDPR